VQGRREGAGLGALLLATASLLVAAPARSAEVAVIPDEEGGSCKVRGVFVVGAPVSIVWDVLTDYDGIGTFVPSMRESRIEPQPDGRRLLRQDAVGGVFLVRRHFHLLLELEEDPERRITFHDVLGKDFRSYSGEWRIASDSSLIQVDYELDAVPQSSLMRMFCRGAMQKAAEDLLEQVRGEIVRRAGEARELASGRHGKAAPAAP
jgi:ribosome-associated toxin RatA of RatAB toxin-antitoxin module